MTIHPGEPTMSIYERTFWDGIPKRWIPQAKTTLGYIRDHAGATKSDVSTAICGRSNNYLYRLLDALIDEK